MKTVTIAGKTFKVRRKYGKDYIGDLLSQRCTYMLRHPNAWDQPYLYAMQCWKRTRHPSGMCHLHRGLMSCTYL